MAQPEQATPGTGPAPPDPGSAPGKDASFPAVAEGREGAMSPAPSPPAAPFPGLAEPQTSLQRVTASSAAGGKLLLINHVLKDDVIGAFPRLRCPSRRAESEPPYYQPRS